MRAKYIGKDGSLRFEKDKIYNINTFIQDNYLFVRAKDDARYLRCPYKNLETMLLYWELQKEGSK